MRRALRTADMSAGEVRHVEVDGYANRLEDAAEFAAIKAVYGTADGSDSVGKDCSLGSLKGNVGNLEPASGAASLLKACLAVSQGTMPATISWSTLNAEIDAEDNGHRLFVQREARRLSPGGKDSVAVNSFADSGVNVHAIVRGVGEQPRGAVADDEYVFLFSGHSDSVLTAWLRRWSEFLRKQMESGEPLDLARLSISLLRRRPMKCRFGCVARDAQSLHDALSRVTADDGPRPDENSGRAKVADRQETRAASDAHAALAGWMEGFSIDPVGLFGVEAPAPLGLLPVYPFAPRRLWVEADRSGQRAQALPTRLDRPTVGKDAIVAHVVAVVSGMLEMPESKSTAVPDLPRSASTRSRSLRSWSSSMRIWGSNRPRRRRSTIPGSKSWRRTSTSSWSHGPHPGAPTPARREAAKAVEVPRLSEVPRSLMLSSGSPSEDTALAGDLDTMKVVEASQRLRQLLRELLELGTHDPLDDTASFSEIGLNSITIVTLIERVNASFAVELPETAAFDHPNIAELAACVVGLSDEQLPVRASAKNDDEVIDAVLRDLDAGSLGVGDVLARLAEMDA